jgi:hypothetical protein
MLIQLLFENADGYSNMNQVSFQTAKFSFSIPFTDRTKFGHGQDRRWISNFLCSGINLRVYLQLYV